MIEYNVLLAKIVLLIFFLFNLHCRNLFNDFTSHTLLKRLPKKTLDHMIILLLMLEWLSENVIPGALITACGVLCVWNTRYTSWIQIVTHFLALIKFICFRNDECSSFLDLRWKLFIMRPCMADFDGQVNIIRKSSFFFVTLLVWITGALFQAAWYESRHLFES